MITSSAVSSVSYCSLDVITHHLDHFVSCGSLDFYCLIKHYAEDDEKKDHWNIFAIPSKRIDTFVLQSCITETVPDNDIPLKTMPFRKSKFDDWVLYHLHDRPYLESKGLFRRYHYRYDEIISSCPDYLHELYSRIPYCAYVRQDTFTQYVLKGVGFSYLCTSGIVPVAQISQYRILYDAIRATMILNGDIDCGSDATLHSAITELKKVMPDL